MLGNELKVMPSMSDNITIVGGRFTKRVEAGTPNAVPRKLTKGKNEGTEVNELHFSCLSGMLIALDVSESNFGGQDGTVTLSDFKAGEIYTIQTQADNGTFTSLLKCLPNIDTSKEVWLQMQPKKNGKLDANGHPLTDLRVFQDGKVVANFYQEYDKQERKYSSINGMPDWEKTPKGWNHDSQDFFLWDALVEFNKTFVPPTADPSFGNLEEEIHNKVQQATVAVDETTQEDDSEEIPF